MTEPASLVPGYRPWPTLGLTETWLASVARSEEVVSAGVLAVLSGEVLASGAVLLPESPISASGEGREHAGGQHER